MGDGEVPIGIGAAECLMSGTARVGAALRRRDAAQAGTVSFKCAARVGTALKVLCDAARAGTVSFKFAAW